MGDSETLWYTLFALLAVAYIVRWRTDPLRSIPTIGGPSAPILSYLNAFNFLTNGKDLMSTGYEKFYGSVFRVSLLDRWMVVVCGSKLVDELRKRPDEELSFVEGVELLMETRFTLGREQIDDPYHVDIVKEKLMRSLTAVLPDVIDELTVAVPDHISAEGDEWITVNAMKTALEIIARASNRVFVGLPLCRNRDYLDLAIQFTIDVMKDKTILNIFPQGLKGFFGQFFNVRRSIRRAIPYFKPLLDERRSKMEEFGDNWIGKPNDMVQWVLEQAIPRNSSDESIVGRILLMNFAAIHTSSNSITHALFDLAAAPEYIQPMREEIESIIAAEGWTKAAMGKMWKLDSFLKESQRFNGISLTSVTRRAMKDIVLSDGITIPKDTLLVAPTYSTHYDESHYSSASEFDPFRFARMREAEGEGTKHQFVNTSTNYIPFGHGRHACPGRFFAANELKAMLAFIVINYDLKIAGNGERPRNLYIANNVIPNPNGEIMFRKRETSRGSM